MTSTAESERRRERESARERGERERERDAAPGVEGRAISGEGGGGMRGGMA